MRTLKVISGPAAGESVGIDKEVVIGREGADLTITDPQISRRHTAVRPVDDGVEIEDLGSLNGTFVNGERLSTPITLTSSGKIRIGDSDIEVEVEVVEDGLTQMAPAAVIADAATRPAAGIRPARRGRSSRRHVSCRHTRRRRCRRAARGRAGAPSPGPAKARHRRRGTSEARSRAPLDTAGGAPRRRRHRRRDLPHA